MPSAPSGVAFTIPQLVSFLHWSADGAHDLAVAVQWEYADFDEVLEVRRRGEERRSPRWLVCRAPDGTLSVVRTALGSWEATAASAEEAQTIIEMDDAEERRASATRARRVGSRPPCP